MGSQESRRRSCDVRVKEWRSFIDRKERMCRMTSTGRASMLEGMSAKASRPDELLKCYQSGFRL
jgi:hypothetical protein